MVSVVYLALMVLAFVGMWKAFEKAGRPGWEGIVPIYNIYILITQIIGKPWWWILLLLIPLVGIVVAIILMIDAAKAYGQGVGFGIGLALLGFIFWPILGFGSAKYVGKVAAGGGFPVIPGK